MAIASLLTPLHAPAVPAMGSRPMLAAADPLSHVVSHELFSIGPFYFTNHMLMSTVAAVLLIWASLGFRKKMIAAMKGDKVITGKGPQLFETICVFVRDQMVRPNLGQLTDRYIPYLWTVFFFIMFANLLGLIPFGPLLGIVASFAGSEYPAYWSHWGGTATGTLALTVPLALTAFIAIVGIGLKEAGIDYLKHFNPGPVFMAPLLVPLEVMGLIIKCCVLAMRLFGTMMAGHLVIAVFLSLIATAAALGAAFTGVVSLSVVVMGFAIMCLELFVALLQAFIFTFLTTLFIAQGAVHHHDGHDHFDEELDYEVEHGLEAAEQRLTHPAA